MKYRKKPIVIEAIQFTGWNQDEVLAFAIPDLSKEACRAAKTMKLPVVIETLEGNMTATPGDWIIRGIKGECYPCAPDVFALTYEPVESQTVANGAQP
jgi:hypothetical protein